MRRQDIGRRELAAASVKASAVILAMAYVFYDSILAVPFLIPLWALYLRECVMDISEKKKQQFLEQFRESIQAVSAALKAGYSVENAIREAQKDMAPMYDEDSRIRKEYSRMIRQLDMKMTLRSVLEQFAHRSGQEDVENFVTVFTASQKSGGDSISVIRSSVRLISERIDTEREIRNMIASQKLEFHIMCIVPFGIILYMKAAFGDFLSVMYGNPAGIMIMTICLLVYTAAYLTGRKLIKIEV